MVLDGTNLDCVWLENKFVFILKTWDFATIRPNEVISGTSVIGSIQMKGENINELTALWAVHFCRSLKPH